MTIKHSSPSLFSGWNVSFFISDLCSWRPRRVCSQSGHSHVIRTGTRAVPHQVTVAPLIILSPIVTCCNSPTHDWWCRCLITPRQNPPKITFRSCGQLHELHEVRWRGGRRGGCHVELLSHARQVCIISEQESAKCHKLWLMTNQLL